MQTELQKRMTKIIIDANIIFHVDWQNIPWHSITEAMETEIIILPILIKEIDGKKSSNQRARDFNSKFISEFRKGANVKLSNRTTVSFLNIIPTTPEFEEHSLDRDLSDDNYICSILKLRIKNPKDQIIFATQDFIPELKAKEKGIEVYAIPDQYLLKQNEESKKIQSLGQQIEQLKYRLPDLELVFENDKAYTSVPKPLPFDASLLDIKALLASAKERYPIAEVISPEERGRREQEKERERYLKAAEWSNSAALPILANALIASPMIFKDLYPDIEEIKRYNNDVEIYLKVLEEYLTTKADYENINSLRLYIRLYIKNIGSSTAKDLRINIKSPSECNFCLIKDAPRIPTEPTPPASPKTFWQKYSGGIESYSRNNLSLQNTKTELNIKESKICSWTLKELKHKEKISLDIIVFEFSSFENLTSFSFDYDLICDELPEKKIDSLHVILE
jgi:hypothetical protein